MNIQRPSRAIQASNLLFSGSLATSLILWIFSQKPWLDHGKWMTHYGVTEWLTNYAGGFVRRGLPGQILLLFGKSTGWDIRWIIFCLSLGIYCLYAYLMIRASRRLYPRWALCSAALIGYPVYTNTLIRKDVLEALLFFLILWVIRSTKPSPLRQITLNILASIAVLSHEIFFFFGLPACLLADLLRSARQRQGTPGLSGLAAWMASGWTLPFALGVASLRSTGSEEMARQIVASWAPLSPAEGGLEQVMQKLPGALSWLGRSAKEYISATHYILSGAHLGLPLWLLVSLALLLAALLITLLFANAADSYSFAIYFLLLMLFMAPVYYTAMDYGRWIFYHLNSAFVLTITTPLPNRLRQWHGLHEGVIKLRHRVPLWASAALLAIWGFPGFGWTLQDWLSGTPLFHIAAKLLAPQ
jgi:hypothetical protein